MWNRTLHVCMLWCAAVCCSVPTFLGTTLCVAHVVTCEALVAVRCSVLQCTAVCCSVLQCVAVCLLSWAQHCAWHTWSHLSTCRASLHSADIIYVRTFWACCCMCHTLRHESTCWAWFRCSVLQCAAVCCCVDTWYHYMWASDVIAYGHLLPPFDCWLWLGLAANNARVMRLPAVFASRSWHNCECIRDSFVTHSLRRRCDFPHVAGGNARRDMIGDACATFRVAVRRDGSCALPFQEA